MIILGAPAPARCKSGERDPMQFQLRWQTVLQDRDRVRASDDQDLYFRRIKLRSNWWISDEVFHHFQFEAKDGMPYLEDAYLFYRPRNGWTLRLGQFKNALSRSLISSSSGLPFEDRPLAAKVFAGSNLQDSRSSKLGAEWNHGIGRMPGAQLAYKWKQANGRTLARIQLHGLQGATRSEFEAGHSFVARTEIYPLGDPGYRIGAYKRVRAPRLALELSFFRDPSSHYVDLNGDGMKTHLDDQRREVRNLGFHYSQSRFSATGEFYRQWYRSLTAGVAAGDSDGFYLHASWLYRPHRDEVSLRYSEVDPLDGVGFDLQREVSLSLARYFGRTPRKLALTHTRVRDEARPRLDESRLSLNWSYEF